MVKGNSWEKKGIYYICIQTIIRVVEICNTSGLISAATLTKFRSRFVKFPWQFCSSKCCIIYNSRKYNTCVLKHFIIIWFYIQVINHAMKTGWANRETSSKLNICYAVSQKKDFFLLTACGSKLLPSMQDKLILFTAVIVLFRHFY